MDTMKFVPVLNEQEHGCCCNVLSLNGVNIMLECGCPENMPVSSMKSLFNENVGAQMAQAHIVLLSHEQLTHSGFLPLFAKVPRRDRVFLTTSPVCKLGHLALYDFYYSRNLMESFDVFTLDQVDSVFEGMRTVKYKEKFCFDTPDTRIKIVPLPSGGTVGGVVWRISYKMLRIVYLSRPYLESEVISDGLNMAEVPKSADLVIIDTNVAGQREDTREGGSRLKPLKKILMEQVEKRYTVVVPSDSGSRSLEIVSRVRHFLEKYQERFGSSAQTCVLMHTMSDRTLEVAHSNMEWMSKKLAQGEEGKSSEKEFVPDLQLMCVTSLGQFYSLRPDTPKIIVCTMNSLEFGLSRLLLQKFIESPNCYFVFPFQPQQGTIADNLLRMGSGTDMISFKVAERTRKGGVKQSDPAMLLDAAGRVQPLQPLQPIQPIQPVQPVQSIQPMQLVEEKKDQREEDPQPPSAAVHFKSKPFMCFDDGHLEKRRKCDDYGEVLSSREKDHLRRLNPTEEPANQKRELERQLEYNNALVKKLRKQEYEEKYSYTYKIAAARPQCRVGQVHFEGVYDMLSLKLVLQYAEPKRIVLFNGARKLQADLKLVLERDRIGKEVHSAVVGHPIGFELDNAMVEMKIHKDFFGANSLERFGELELCKFAGEISSDYVDSKGRHFPMLMPVDKSEEGEMKDPMFFKASRLTLIDLLSALNEKGLQAVLVDNTIYCGSKLVISECEGQIKMEGVMCPEYFRARDLLYSKYFKV